MSCGLNIEPISTSKTNLLWPFSSLNVGTPILSLDGVSWPGELDGDLEPAGELLMPMAEKWADDAGLQKNSSFIRIKKFQKKNFSNLLNNFMSFVI